MLDTSRIRNLPPAAIGIAAAGLLLLLIIYQIYKWKKTRDANLANAPPLSRLVHQLPKHDVLQEYKLGQKDSLDGHLDILTQKLADKEGKLQLSKSKIRETQHEIENLHAIDQDVRAKYREVMDSLKTDLISNESECKKIQEQIEWVSRKRAELRDEVRRGQRLYGEAAADLAINLSELQRGRVTDKPGGQSIASLRHRGGPCPFTRVTPAGSVVMKSTPDTPEVVLSRNLSPNKLH